MALIDNRQKPAESQTVAEAAYLIRNIVKAEANSLNNKLGLIRGLVQKHTRSAIAEELGSDAAEMLSIYNAMKSLAELIDASETVDDLPA